MEATKPARKLGVFGQANRLAVTVLESTANTILSTTKSIEHGLKVVEYNAMDMRDESAVEYYQQRMTRSSLLLSLGYSQPQVDEILAQ